jgi:hypothetical protein
MITVEQIQEINNLGHFFFWSDVLKEYLDDSGENEMGISYYPHPDGPYTLRARLWNDEDGEYEDDYENFRTFEDLKAYLT